MEEEIAKEIIKKPDFMSEKQFITFIIVVIVLGCIGLGLLYMNYLGIEAAKIAYTECNPAELCKQCLMNGILVGSGV